MTAIELKAVHKAWGDSVAVRDISFSVEAGSFLVLLGPSGCGKSTTLRMIAGLEEATAGQVLIDGKDMTQAPPAERRLSMVFQSYALFPHLSVAENIVFGLKVRKVAAADRTRRLEEVAAMVGLSELLRRKPGQLSGGQKQRVALARAIVAENAICLMDEPLSNLDAKLRHDMRGEIRGLQRRLGMTVVYVTHDQSEAMSMADRVILMRDGRIEQAGPPERLYDKPATTFAAGFIGTPPMNLLRLADGPGGATIEGSEGPAVLEGQGRGLILGLRPEHVEIAPREEAAERRAIPAKLLWADYLGADTLVQADLGTQQLTLRVPHRLKFEPGCPVGLIWHPDEVHVFDGESGKRLNGRRARSLAV